MTVHVLPSGPIQTNAYLLTDSKSGEAVLVDAPGGVWEKVSPILGSTGCRLTSLWLTHGHWDHTQGAAEVVRRSGARVLAHEADKLLIEQPQIMSPFLIPGVSLEPVSVDQWVKSGDILSSLGTSAEVRHVPGHCPGNILFYLPTIESAFVGDALFQGSVGRTDLPGGDFAELERSIRSQIYTLPGTTRIYPGHGAPTTVGTEKAHNPYVAA